MAADPLTEIELSDKPDLAEGLLVAGHMELIGTDCEPEDIPLFYAGSIAAALVDARGGVSRASPAFEAMGGAGLIESDVVARVQKSGEPLAVTVDLPGTGGAPDSAIFLYAPAGRAAKWRLPPEIRQAAEAGPGQVVVLTGQSAHAAKPLEGACRAYGLSGLQTRVVLETIRTGSVKSGSEALGISYHTAREALAESLKRVRVARLPALVARLTSLSFGVLPKADAADVLGDLWGLTPRQAAIAGLVASGVSRGEVAGALSVSEAVVRKELELVHLVLQVSSAAGLARKVVEAHALRWLTVATGGDIGFVEASAEPLQFVHRTDGGRIAFSDYGPASGKPILVVHSSTTSRIVARALLRALHGTGYRPIAIDRPGFGLTDELPGMQAGAHDPFAAATDDTLRVLDHLKIRRADLVARGAAQFVLALERAAPGRLGRVVLVNPDPHSAESGQRPTMVSLTKEVFRRNPALIKLMAGPFTRRVTYEEVARRIQRGARGSPPDEAAVRDPELLRDYFRAVRTFATGRHAGYINEQIAFARGGRPETLAGTTDWRVLVGAHDFLHDPQAVAAYWRAVLPDACLSVVADTGRYLAFSHPQHVIGALVDKDA